MPQLHFTVDPRTAARIEREAKRRGVSVSKYLASLMARELGEQWPSGYLASVVGACAQHPLKAPRELPLDDVRFPAD